MKKLIWILIAVAALLLVTGAIVFIVAQPPEQDPETTDGAQFPGGSGTVPTSSTDVTKLLVYTRGSGTVEVNDFIHDGVTVADVVNEGRYILVGELGYCLADGSCPRATDVMDFAISYSSESDVFTVTLLKEPLSATRIAAEQTLMQRLGLSSADLCELNYYVGTPSFVNEVYSNGNIGFSFCEGAAKLP